MNQIPLHHRRQPDPPGTIKPLSDIYYIDQIIAFLPPFPLLHFLRRDIYSVF